ncbi:MAG: hypothetical protein ABSD57_14955 [Verrucomicrobiota bacterium]
MAHKRRSNSWDTCTWEGARHEQLRRWGKLTLREKLKAVEEMGKVAARFAKMRRSSRPTARAT